MKKDNLENNSLKKNSFNVPNGYFDSLEETVFSKLSEEKFPDKKGFITPENYFDQIEDTVLEKLEAQKFSKTTGFEVPDNYFDTVESAVVKKIPGKEPKVINFRRKLLTRILPLASAAAIALFFILNYNRTKSADLDKIATSEIENWIENDLIAVDAYEIAEVYQDVELENQGLYTEEEIYDYLNGTDIETLFIENQ